MCKTRMNFCQSLERLPRRLFANGHIRIVRPHLFAVGGVGHAHGQSPRHQGENYSNFFLLKRKRIVIARNHLSRRFQRIRFAQNRVSRCNGRLRNRQPMVHVSKINDARDFARLGPRIAHQYVVVIRVAVNHTAAQMRQPGDNFVFIKFHELFHQRAPFRALDFRKELLNPNGSRRIPLQLPMRCRMLERLQRRIHLAQEAPQVAKQLRCARTHLRKNRSLQETQQPD